MAKKAKYEVPKLRGHQGWKLRANVGREKIFSDGQLLIAHAEAYFHWCDTHPRYSVELVKHQGSYVEAELPLGRPYTMDGLTRYLGVSGGYFRAAKANLRAKIEEGRATPVEVELLEAIEMIETTVRNEQIEGALVGQYKESLTARINGIADNVNQNNQGGTPLVRIMVRDTETANNLDDLAKVL